MNEDLDNICEECKEEDESVFLNGRVLMLAPLGTRKV